MAAFSVTCLLGYSLEWNPFPGSEGGLSRYLSLYPYMGQICFPLFAFVENRCCDFTFPAVPEFSGSHPFMIEKELPLSGKPNHIVLLSFIKLQEHLIIIIAPVHNKSSFPNIAFPRSMASKVISLMDVKFFSFEEWILE
jgi:hypothetical protein